MPRPALVAIAVLLVGGIATYAYLRPSDGTTPSERLAGQDRTFEDDDPIARGCALDPAILERIARGHDPERSEDVTAVPQAPNYYGSFAVNSHTGPWDYVQRIPLVVYGTRIPSVDVDRPVTLADVYPTVGELTGTGLPERDGTTLKEAVPAGAARTADLVVTIVWDGVGSNVLARWPDAWPNLARIMGEGAFYENATVGSSPSVTPATHSTLGTGRFPATHRVTAIQYRARDGRVHEAFAGRNPAILASTTYGDDIDAAYDNASRVGMLAWQPWHLGMLGHGAASPPADKDLLALIEEDGTVKGNDAFYSTPSYLDREFDYLEAQADELDRGDGEADGLWRGREILEEHNNPAWVQHQGHLLLQILEREGFGAAPPSDLFMTNYKATDVIGHSFTMDSPAMEEVLRAQDAELGRLVEWLERGVDDFVVILTADHGSTPRAERSGAWAIDPAELTADIDEHFGVPSGRSLVEQPTAVGPFLGPAVAPDLGVTAEDVARFLNSYRLADNWPDADLPDGYEKRGDENLFAASFARDQLDLVLDCASQSASP